jgi:iron complex outermembrane receptor protein
LIGLTAPAIAQEVDTKLQKVEITGSSIKRIQTEGALPVQVITRAEMQKQGIVTAEQLIMTLNSNGTGADNLASNTDVTSGAQRGNNGGSAANLRGQGSDSTLVLLNGRRIATYGMKGQTVDLGSIPFAAVERVEVLKDGASAIYGTDAIGGVINFILRSNFTGAEVNAFEDVTQQKGGNIARVSLIAGTGDLDKDGANFLFTLSHSANKALRGDQRDFVNTFQPNRGLSVDTRGTPYATVFAASQGKNILSNSSTTGPIQPGTTQPMTGINVLDLPGQAGCSSIPGQAAYDEVLWDTASAKWGCAWDTGRAALLQQPISNTSFVARGTFKFGEHQLYAEAVGGRNESSKSFSPNQISAGATFGPASWYPSTGAAYNTVFNAIAAVFPTIQANYGSPIAYRWRCMECGNREFQTTADSGRLMFGADGPIGNWDYKIAAGQSFSSAYSVLGSGFFYQAPFIAALGTGIINPFLAAGQTQSQAALDLIASTSARGVVLYSGRSVMSQFGASASGELFKMPAGSAMAAVGIDLRKEEYKFSGDERDASNKPVIFNAPFDDTNILSNVSRSITAYYAELLLPVTKSLEVNIAARRDTYTGFGSTNNPKISFRFTPIEELLFRGSYNTGFRVPAFNQLFNGVTVSPYSGKDLADPATCPTIKVDATKAGCQSVVPVILTGGKDSLGPETSKQASLGIVIQPTKWFSASADYWEIRRENVIRTIALTTLVNNYSLFSANFLHDSTGALAAVDQRWVNTGAAQTRGVEIGANANGNLMAGKWSANLDGSYLVEKKSKLLANSPWGASEVGLWSTYGDLGLRWKHTANFTYKQGDWSTSLYQVYRAGYTNQVLPGVANGKVSPPDVVTQVDAYQIFHVSATYTGFKALTLTGGIKNLLNTDPPFAATYDSNTGAGSSWESRVADPRGRSFTLMINYKFM